jgi:large subunit ribosomal protein L29
MDISEVRQLNDGELAETLEDRRRSLMNLRFRAATLQLSDFSEIGKTRRDIARLMTVQRERAIAQEIEG